MKKYIVIFLMILGNFSYAIKDLTTLKTLKFDAEEKQIVNSKEKILKYSVIIEFPNKIRKEIQFPSLNKGEVYIYNGETKQVYLPIFDEYRETKTDIDENRIIQAINKIKDLEKIPETKKTYYNKELKEFHIDEEDNISIFIKEYIELDDYLLPQEIEIKNTNINIGLVRLENIEVNPKLEQESFKFKK